MAHFAQLDENNIVLKVIVVDNSNCLDGNGDESEAVGVAYCQSILGDSTTWKQTSYNKNFRANYASVGYTYDPTNNVFIAPRPYPSWSLNTTSWGWDPPVAYPIDNKVYSWNEASRTWVER